MNDKTITSYINQRQTTDESFTSMEEKKLTISPGKPLDPNRFGYHVNQSSAAP